MAHGSLPAHPLLHYVRFLVVLTALRLWAYPPVCIVFDELVE